MNLQSIKRTDVPLHAEVAAVLRHQILSGDLVPGARLPALRELTESLGVARMTVVQAMNTLQDEGLIQKQAGRGTFVRDVPLTKRHVMQMKAPLAELHAMVDGLEVSVQSDAAAQIEDTDGRAYRVMQRIHSRDGKPFCQVDIQLDAEIYARAPKRFDAEIVVSVLRDLGIEVARATQKITISYADFELANALGVKVNSAVFRVRRAFMDAADALIYSAELAYPGDLLELEMEFLV